MQERQLPFNTDQNPSPVILDDKVKSEVFKTASDLHFAVSTFADMIKNNTLKEGFKNTLLSLFESYVVDIHKQLNYESHLKAENERRVVEIRSLNHENHELRKQLGEKVSNDDVREKLKLMHEAICDWWDKKGFGHISDISFRQYSCKVTLSCLLACHHPDKQDEYLVGKGYQLCTDDGIYPYATDHNRALIAKEICARFPSAALTETKITYYRKKEGIIRDCEFLIKDFNDI